MKKLLVTCVLIMLGTLPVIAKTFTASKIKKLKYGYEFTTDSGEKIKAFAWGKEDKVQELIDNNKTATFTMERTPNGKANKITKIVMGKGGAASKAETKEGASTFTATKIKKLKYGYQFTTDSGKKINAFAWGKEDKVQQLIDNGKTATFTMERTPNGKANKITKIVMGKGGAASKAETKEGASTFTATKIKKLKFGYQFTTDSGKKINAFAWGKEDKVQKLIDTGKTATFTMERTPNGKANKITKIVMGKGGTAPKAATATKKGGSTFTATKIKKLKFGYEFTTDSGKKINAFAWGKEDKVQELIDNNTTATFTMERTPNGKANKITKIVVGKGSKATKTKTKTAKVKTVVKEGGDTFTASKVKKLKFNYLFTTDSGKKIKAYVWGKQKDILKGIMKNGNTATYTMVKTKKGNNKITQIEVID